MQAKVHAFEDEIADKANNDKPEKPSTLTAQDIKDFRVEFGKMCKILNDFNDKLKETEKAEEAVVKKLENQTTWERIKDNKLRDMFVGHDVNTEDIDNVVSTLTLMNALILTIPYGLMSAADNSYWDWVEETLAACPLPHTEGFTYEANFGFFSRSFNSVIYCTITDLIVAMIYYLLRPKDELKFRAWWKNARYVVIGLLVGTITSVVSLITISAWLFSWYMIPTSRFCTYSAADQTFTGVTIVVVCFLISMYLMM